MRTRHGLKSLSALALIAGVMACSGSSGENASSEDAVKAKCVNEEALLTLGFDRAMAKWLDAAATDLRDNQATLARIESIVGDAKVIGLGEPDQGFHEFPELRNAVLKMLVEKKDVRALTL